MQCDGDDRLDLLFTEQFLNVHNVAFMYVQFVAFAQIEDTKRNSYSRGRTLRLWHSFKGGHICKIKHLTQL